MPPKRKRSKHAPEGGNNPPTQRTSTRKKQANKKFREQPADNPSSSTTSTDSFDPNAVLKQIQKQQEEIIKKTTEQDKIIKQQAEIIKSMKTPTPLQPHSSESTATDSESEDSDSNSISDSESEGKCSMQYTQHKPVISGGLSVGHSTPHKLRKKIWEQKYIDFSDLLNPHTNHNTYSLSLSTSSFTNKPDINFTSRNKKVLSEIQWGMAWDIYMAIYLEKYQDQLQQMITYHHNIMKLMNGGANWRTYDFQFRVDREYQQCPWDTVRVDLERDAYLGLGVARTSTHSFRGNNYKTSPQIPRGYCYAYHTHGQRCDNIYTCKHKHTCPTCHERHPLFRHGYTYTKPSPTTQPKKQDNNATHTHQRRVAK